jgi:hypothetical protein
MSVETTAAVVPGGEEDWTLSVIADRLQGVRIDAST